MRHYQPKRNNPYRLPHNVYMQCLYAVRDYDRIRKERDDLLYASPLHDGQPTAPGAPDPVANTVMRRSALDKMCEDVEQALILVPPEYRKGIMDNILYGASYPLDAGEATYKRWRCKLIYFVAKNKNLV